MIRVWLTMGQEYNGICVSNILIGRCHWFCMVCLSVIVYSREGSVGGTYDLLIMLKAPKRRNL